MTPNSTTQRITRLTPLAAILSLIETRVAPVAPRQFRLDGATVGRIPAGDVAAGPLPASPVALRDGFAVNAADVLDAGPYAPLPLPVAQQIEAGARMPAGTDAVLPVDAVTVRSGRAEAVAAATVGEGVLPAGGDFASGALLRCAGEQLRSMDRAVMQAAGVAEIALRVPRVHLANGGFAQTAVIDAALGWLARAIADAGGEVLPPRESNDLGAALGDRSTDLVIAIGGTGSGQRDTAVNTLARIGQVEAHGIAISPGDTAAFGFVGSKPALLIPGRLDATLAVWLLIGRRLLAALAGAVVSDTSRMMPLRRKVASTIGLTELIPVRCVDVVAEPLASGYLSFESLARSDGWIAVPAESEGFPAGTPVAVHPWP